MNRISIYIKAALIGLIFVGLHVAANAQQLNIKKTNGKTRTIKLNKAFYFKVSADDEFKKGKIQSITDTSLVIFTPEEEDIQLREVPLKNLYSVKKMTCIHKAGYVAGGALILGGAATIFEAPGIAGDEGSDWLVRGIGAGAVLVGLVPYLIKPTEFVQGQNAEFSISK